MRDPSESRPTLGLRALLLALALLIAPAVMATGIVRAAPAGASGSAGVTLEGFAFSPGVLTISAGTTVTVTNQDPTTHTWSSDPGDAQTWDSGPIAPGSWFSVTFGTAGEFGYHCNIHPSMTGTIVVTPAPPTTVAPPPTTTPTTARKGPPTTAVIDAAAPAPVGAPTVLPRTGASSIPALVGLAGAALGLGAIFVTSGRRRRRSGA